MVIVYLALGSNVGDSDAHIDNAIRQLRQKIIDIKVATRYHSKAVGYTDQPDFVNTALTGKTDLSPQALLQFVKAVELEVGRVKRFRWGPREIDIDIIFYGDRVVDEPTLHIPHARFAGRDFVLRPICDLQPDLVDPRTGLTISQLYRKLARSKRAILSD